VVVTPGDPLLPELQGMRMVREAIFWKDSADSDDSNELFPESSTATGHELRRWAPRQLFGSRMLLAMAAEVV
jgi:hypothetical protein